MKVRKLLLIVGLDWGSSSALGFCYEQIGSQWQCVRYQMEVLLGKKGMAWGRGLHGDQPGKKEGDRKTPVGLFAIPMAFGKGQRKPKHIPYLELTPSIEAVDDPNSSYYNKIVDRNVIADPDWNSSEKMFEEKGYEKGFVIANNDPDPVSHRGSAIFLHLRNRTMKATLGCSCFHPEDLNFLWDWIDDNTVLAQLPIEIYDTYKEAWNLPLHIFEPEPEPRT